jgi:hypothetical protein
MQVALFFMKHAMADAHTLEHNGWTFSSFRGPIGNKDQVRARRGDLRNSFPIPPHLPPPFPHPTPPRSTAPSRMSSRSATSPFPR